MESITSDPQTPILKHSSGCQDSYPGDIALEQAVKKLTFFSFFCKYSLKANSLCQHSHRNTVAYQKCIPGTVKKKLDINHIAFHFHTAVGSHSV